MEYRGYTIMAHVNVTETWDFEANSDGDITFTSMADRSDPLNVEEFIVYDTESYLLDQEFSSLADAKKYIDSLTMPNISEDTPYKADIPQEA